MEVKYVRNLDGFDLNANYTSDGFDKLIEVKGDSITVENINILNKGDTFIIDKLSVLGYNTASNLEMLKELRSRGIKIISLDCGEIDDKKIDDLEYMLNYERECMIERMLRAKHKAKHRKEDFADGRPRIYGKEVQKYVIQLIEAGNTYDEITKITGISKSTISRIKKRYNKSNKE